MCSMEVIAVGDEKMLVRACVDCGRYTGRFCDFCLAADRLPNEQWAKGQMTPLCSDCDNKFDACHFCRGVSSCTPPPGTQGPGTTATRPAADRSAAQISDMSCSKAFLFQRPPEFLRPLPAFMLSGESLPPPQGHLEG